MYSYFMAKKNAYALKTPHVVFLPVIFPSFFFGRSKALRSQLSNPMNIFLPCDLWPMTLTYKLDLDILPLDLHAKIQMCMSMYVDVKTITPDTSETWGVKMKCTPTLDHGWILHMILDRIRFSLFLQTWKECIPTPLFFKIFLPLSPKRNKK